MRQVGLVPAILLVGACGTQELAFDEVDGGADAASSATGCSSDGDCRLANLHCDPLSRQCVACVNDDQCKQQPGHHVCDSALHQCVECGVDGDCPGGRCEPISHRCVPSCADGGLCPGDLLCNQHTGMCLGCMNDADCAGARGGSVCDTVVGQCVQCLTDTQCSSYRPLCNRTTGRCVECLSSQSCYPGESCDPATHTCVDNPGGSFHEGGTYMFPDGSTDAQNR